MKLLNLPPLLCTVAVFLYLDVRFGNAYLVKQTTALDEDAGELQQNLIDTQKKKSEAVDQEDLEKIGKAIADAKPKKDDDTDADEKPKKKNEEDVNEKPKKDSETNDKTQKEEGNTDGKTPIKESKTDEKVPKKEDEIGDTPTNEIETDVDETPNNENETNIDETLKSEREKDNGETPNNESEKNDDNDEDQSFTLFTIANTDINFDYGKIPYRERYQWNKQEAPCLSFDLKIPSEMEENSVITLCIFRRSLEFPDETKLFILNAPSEGNMVPQQQVSGYVMKTAVSSVYGRIVDRFFYGEVSIFSKSTKSTTIYVVEEINLLNRLMRNNQKTLKHLLMVMRGKSKETEKPVIYNAVVTKGASLIDFMTFTNPTDINRNSFMMFTTNHNSWICSGSPTMKVDADTQIELEIGNNKISVDNEGSVRLSTKDKMYTFRPHGRTIVSEKMELRKSQELEGAVAITAFTATSGYDCVLPTPSFQPKRKGGYVCKVCVAMDDMFIKHFVSVHTKDKDAESNYLGQIIDHVSWLLRAMDLNDDKKPENIGLDYDAQSLRWAYPDNENENLNEQDIEILFQSLANYDFADCCLGIGYTMKNFPNNDFARRPKNNDEAPNTRGVCAGKLGRIPSNLIIISANDKTGKYSAISEKQLAYLTANQIMGAFGALPDGSGNDLCDEFIDDHKITRHYLMWPDFLRNTTLKEQTLSPCSIKDIVKTLSACKSSCFDVDRHPFCGNGIVEEGEECDCGSEYNCKLQTCCYPRAGEHPCRKSGIGCKSGSSSLANCQILVIFSLLATVCMQFYVK